MAESASTYVGLFIDWDNLAISTAADLGGATPDIKRIIHKAQEFGQIVVARAYAEWNTMSERLSVYRAGIEPVYAPTFRFETDPVTQLSRGKSLADPVMVADCVDSLHILPQISVYVMVTGDKDMIPVVRLAQLRSKRVVVIGPDMVAGVLREMADDFVSYRTLVQAEAPAPSRVQEPVVPMHRRPPGRAPAPVRVPPPPRLIPTPVAAQPVEEKEPETGPEIPELSEVFLALVDILRSMAESGRIKVRATNLKDQLLLRMAGFSERKYGFSKFKDLLVAAERAGMVAVSAAGPVHWVSLPAAAVEEALAPAASVAPSPATETREAPAAPVAVDEQELAAQVHRRRLAVVRFVDELRLRSRWLTYTYVLTNVIGFIGRMVPPGEAEAEARSILNHLVAADALRIDKVPQEVDVGGIKHRVRMCHFVEDHALVREARAAALEDLPPELRSELHSAPQAESPTEIRLGSPEAEGMERRATPAGEPSLELAATQAVTPQTDEGGNWRLPSAAEAEQAEPEQPATAGIDDLAAERSRSRSRRGRRRPRSAAARAARAELDELAAAEDDEEQQAEAPYEAQAEPIELVALLAEAVEPQAKAAKEAIEPAQAAADVPSPEPAWSAPVAAEAATVATEADEFGAPILPVGPAPSEAPLRPAEMPKPSREEVFETVRRIVSEQAALGKARLTGSSLKLRLGKAFPGFDERQYGFSKFKDFLRAVEATGGVEVDTEGQVSWVRLPRVETEEAPVPAQGASDGAGPLAAREGEK